MLSQSGNMQIKDITVTYSRCAYIQVIFQGPFKVKLTAVNSLIVLIPRDSRRD